MTTGADTIDQEIRIAARRETVFAFLVEPDKMVRWMGSRVQIDPRPGGIYRIEHSKDTILGEYVQVQPPERVVFTFGFEGDNPVPAGTTTVEITLTADGDSTILRLRHTRLPTGEARGAFAEGWKHFLERLTTVAAGGDPGPDPWADENM